MSPLAPSARSVSGVPIGDLVNEYEGLSSETLLPNVIGLRDYFAGQAVVGLLAANTGTTVEWLVKEAYKYADAMIATKEES